MVRLSTNVYTVNYQVSFSLIQRMDQRDIIHKHAYIYTSINLL